MKITELTFASLGILVHLTAHTAADAKTHGHSHGDGHSPFSAGEPGDPKKASRTIQVVMLEHDGTMLFVPDRLEINRGEQVRFLLRNNGEIEHEFVLATTEENLKHADEMKKNPQMHEHPNGRRVDPKKRSEILWRFTKQGRFEYGCLIPGHREAGMTGIVVVK
jgi:uncharacterized cupredoxin-like copper-binding protein